MGRAKYSQEARQADLRVKLECIQAVSTLISYLQLIVFYEKPSVIIECNYRFKTQEGARRFLSWLKLGSSGQRFNFWISGAPDEQMKTHTVKASLCVRMIL